MHYCKDTWCIISVFFLQTSRCLTAGGDALNSTLWQKLIVKSFSACQFLNASKQKVVGKLHISAILLVICTISQWYMYKYICRWYNGIMHHKRTSKGYPGMDFGWFLHFCWVQDRRYFILLTVGNVGNAIQVGYHGSSATQTLVCASTLSMKGGVVRKCAGKLGKPQHFCCASKMMPLFFSVFFRAGNCSTSQQQWKKHEKPWYIEGCRLVPYRFSETKSQMVPKDLNQNIGFQVWLWFRAKSTTQYFF